jgi:carbon storage regulator
LFERSTERSFRLSSRSAQPATNPKKSSRLPAFLLSRFSVLGGRMGLRASIASMLIIARRKGQRILIGDDVEVIVTELSKGVVKLGIMAPVTRTILRGETKDVADANRAAAQTSLDQLPTVKTTKD